MPVIVHYSSPLEERAAFLEKLGLITVNFALLENNMKEAVVRLLGLDLQAGAIVTAGLSFSALLTLLGALAEDQLDGTVHLAKFRKKLNEIDNAVHERNKITHSVWGIAPETDRDWVRVAGRLPEKPGDVVVRMKTIVRQKGLFHQAQNYSIADLQSVADNLSRLAFEISGFPPLETRRA